MRNPLRSLLLPATLCLAGAIIAQTHTIFVAGHMTPCDPSLNGTIVNVHVYGHQSGPVVVATPLNENCYYYVELQVPDTAGTVFVGATCANGNFLQDTALYTVTPPFSTDVIVDLDCGNAATDCNACFTMTTTAPFTADFNGSCSSGGTGTITYLWDFSSGGAQLGQTTSHTFPGPGTYTACLNYMDGSGCHNADCRQVYVDAEGNISFEQTQGCQACFTMEQNMNGSLPQPFSMRLISCSTGAGVLQTEWQLPNGAFSFQPSPTYQFSAPGVYGVCLYLTAANGCSSVVCDTVVVDPNGMINSPTPWTDCNGVLWGSNTPGTPCTANGVVGELSPSCECIPNTTDDCNADFWVLQAWSAVNGDTLPTANELWIWNLSSGESPFSFLWTFGDGNSSTEAYPTHTYAGTGPYELCLTVTDNVGCTSTYCDLLELDEEGFLNGMAPNGTHGQGNSAARSGLTINVLPGSPTSVAPARQATDISLYPNPVGDQLQVRTNTTGRYTLELLTIEGRPVRSELINTIAGAEQVLDVAHLHSGVYLLRLNDGQNNLVRRFVKR